jgi:ABC-2 type transport system ATP-binding protein
VDGIDLSVFRGEVFALLGPNGAGKTTTVEILEGYRRRDAGEVSVLGVDPDRADARWRSRVGIVLQGTGEFDDLTVAEVVHHFAGFYPDPDDPDKVIERVGLADKARARTHTLSGGQKRRLDVALGIIGRPELLFLDEPTAGFDPQARREFHQVVHRLADLEHTTILLTTHDLDEAEKLADRVLILAGGKIVADDTAEQLALRAALGVEVKWSRGGERFVHSTDDATEFVRRLLNEPGDPVTDLEVRRASLEDAYLDLVQRYESGQSDEAVRAFTEVV